MRSFFISSVVTLSFFFMIEISFSCLGNFYEFHKLAIDELEAFDYEEYKKNGFKVHKLGDYDLTLDFDKKPE